MARQFDLSDLDYLRAFHGWDPLRRGARDDGALVASRRTRDLWPDPHAVNEARAGICPASARIANAASHN
jgi:hypothetical protein